MSKVDEQARRVAIQHAIASRLTDIEGEYQLLSTGERLNRIDGLLEEIGSAWEGEDDIIAPALVWLAAEAQAWLGALEAQAAQ